MSGALAPGTRVLVAGGGIGGLTVGIALRRAGFDPIVIERHARPADVGAGISLWPNAVHPLRELGLGDGLDAIGWEPAGGALRLANGRTLASLPGARLSDRFGAPVLLVHRADLVDLLRGALPAGALRDGAPITDVAERDDGVSVTLEGGEQLDGALLVAADGVRSLVREPSLGRRSRSSEWDVAWRAVVPLGDELAQLEGETWGRGLLFGAVPLRASGSTGSRQRARTSTATRTRSASATRCALRFDSWDVPAAALIARTDPRRSSVRRSWSVRSGSRWRGVAWRCSVTRRIRCSRTSDRAAARRSRTPSSWPPRSPPSPTSRRPWRATTRCAGSG